MGKALLFYFPGQTEPQAQKVFASWLPGLGVDNLMWGYWHKGPDEKAGAFCYFSPADNAHRPRLDPAEDQKWIPLPEYTDLNRPKDALWVGVDGEVLPGAVARRQQLRGNLVPLADQTNYWLIPAVQLLPHKFGLGANGQYVRNVEEKYEAWASKAFTYMREIFTALDMWDTAKNAVQIPESDANLDVETTIQLKDSIEFICESIGMNYLLNQELIFALDLLDDAANQRAIAATFDMPSIIEFCNDPQKKTEDIVTIPATSNT